MGVFKSGCGSMYVSYFHLLVDQRNREFMSDWSCFGLEPSNRCHPKAMESEAGRPGRQRRRLLPPHPRFASRSALRVGQPTPCRPLSVMRLARAFAENPPGSLACVAMYTSYQVASPGARSLDLTYRLRGARHAKRASEALGKHRREICATRRIVRWRSVLLLVSEAQGPHSGALEFETQPPSAGPWCLGR